MGEVMQPLRRRVIRLDPAHLDWALQVAEGREVTPEPWTPLDSGENSLEGNVRGAMAEIAVCIYTGVPYRDHVDVYSYRPGASPDLVVNGSKISVKSTRRKDPGYSMVVHEYDVENDFYVLVYVDVAPAVCELLGYITKAQLLTYEPEPWKNWKGDNGLPGANKPNKLRRYIPQRDLTPVREAS